MKKLTFTIFTFLILSVGLIFISFTSKVNQRGGSPDGIENIPDNLFIPDAFFTKYQLEMAPRSNNHIKDWSTLDRTAKILVVDDVRWEFKNAAEALEWHKKHLNENSESGIEIKDKIYLPAAQDIHIYRESKSIADLNKSMGIDTKEYYFLFTIDKVVVKVFVTEAGTASVDDAAIFAKEAAKNVRNALGITPPPPPKVAPAPKIVPKTNMPASSKK